jgi:hypothetical protein
MQNPIPPLNTLEQIEDVSWILQNAAQTVGIEPHDSAVVSFLPPETAKGLPACALFVLAFDSHKAAVAVANEAKRNANPARKLSAHVCTGHGIFKRLSIVTLI